MVIEMNDVDESIIVTAGIENFGAKRDDDPIDFNKLTIRYDNGKVIDLVYNDPQKMFTDAGKLAKHIGY